ncbi:DUF1573 domain-containing protein [Niabella terrae]
MKKLYLILVVFFAGLITVQAQSKTSAKPVTSADNAIKMVKEKYDIGKVPQGKPVTFYMEFVNQTKKPLVVKNVLAGCGCTVPEKPKEPIMPGKNGKVKVEYSAPSVGPVNKDVEIYIAGYDEPKIVYFTGEVVAAAAKK